MNAGFLRRGSFGATRARTSNAYPGSYGDGAENVRVLLLGDSGVGKTAIVNALCGRIAAGSTGWTVGCHLDCAMFQDVSSNRSFVVEFVDVGGGSHGYAASRDIFYTYNINAVLVVHDLSNRRSFSNLTKWIEEYAAANNTNAASICDQIPVLLVGNKLDKLNVKHRAQNNLRKQAYTTVFKNTYGNVEVSAEASANNFPIRKFQDFFVHVLNHNNHRNGSRV